MWPIILFTYENIMSYNLLLNTLYKRSSDSENSPLLTITLDWRLSIIVLNQKQDKARNKNISDGKWSMYLEQRFIRKQKWSIRRIKETTFDITSHITFFDKLLLWHFHLHLLLLINFYCIYPRQIKKSFSFLKIYKYKRVSRFSFVY